MSERNKNKSKGAKKKTSNIEQIKFKGVHNCKYHHCGLFEVGVCETGRIFLCPDTHRKVLKTYFTNYDNCSFTPIYDLEDDEETEETDETDDTDDTASKSEHSGNEENEEEGDEFYDDEEEDLEIAVIYKEFPNLMLVFSSEYAPELNTKLESCSYLNSEILKKRIDGRNFIDEDYMESKLKTDHPNFYELLKQLKEKIKSGVMSNLFDIYPLFEKCVSMKDDKKEDKNGKSEETSESKKSIFDDSSDEDEDDELVNSHMFQINIFEGQNCEKVGKKQIATWSPRTWSELKELDYKLDYIDGDKIIEQPELNLKISLPLLKPKVIKIIAKNEKYFTMDEILDAISKEYMKIYDDQGTEYRKSDILIDYTESIDVRYKRLYQKALSLWRKLMKEKYEIKSKSQLQNVMFECDQEEDETTETPEKSGKKEQEPEPDDELEDEYDEPDDIDFFQSLGDNPLFLFYRPDSLDYSSLEYNSKTKTICPVLDIDKLPFMDCNDFYELRDLLYDFSLEFNSNGRNDDQ